MTSDELHRWRLSFPGRQVSRADAAIMLGCSERAILNWEQGRKVPRYIALAVAAVEAGLEPYSQETNQ